MSRRYDSRTTIFSPEGRLYQVEYAMEAISHAGLAIGILASDGIVLAAEHKMVSQLLESDQPSQEKIYKINDSMVMAVAGITSDANILVQNARLTSQRYLYTFQNDIPVESLVQRIGNVKQGYTQFGGLRPFGVSFIYGGYDAYLGYQLYQSDPSGNYSGWKATSMGSNASNVQSILKSDYVEGMNLREAQNLAIKAFKKVLGDASSLSAEKIEMTLLTKNEDGNIIIRDLKASELTKLIHSVVVEDESSGSLSEGAQARAEPLYSTTVS